MNLSQYVGESANHVVKLTKGGAPFDPVGHNLIFTAKADLGDEDADALFQKSTQAGITTTQQGGAFYAEVGVIPLDTATALPGTGYWDIRAEHNTSGRTSIVAGGLLNLLRPVTRRQTVSVPIYTTSPTGGDARYLGAPFASLKGSTDSLSALPTSALAVTSSMRGVVIPGALQWWQLQTWDGVAAEDTANGLLLPDDFNAITNAKIWVRIS